MNPLNPVSVSPRLPHEERHERVRDGRPGVRQAIVVHAVGGGGLN